MFNIFKGQLIDEMDWLDTPLNKELMKLLESIQELNKVIKPPKPPLSKKELLEKVEQEEFNQRCLKSGICPECGCKINNCSKLEYFGDLGVCRVGENIYHCSNCNKKFSL